MACSISALCNLEELSFWTSKYKFLQMLHQYTCEKKVYSLLVRHKSQHLSINLTLLIISFCYSRCMIDNTAADRYGIEREKKLQSKWVKQFYLARGDFIGNTT